MQALVTLTTYLTIEKLKMNNTNQAIHDLAYRCSTGNENQIALQVLIDTCATIVLDCCDNKGQFMTEKDVNIVFFELWGV